MSHINMAATNIQTDGPHVESWQEFTETIQKRGYPLLSRLDEFPNSILVTGCQRSGTTVLAKIITESDGVIYYQFSSDNELDAALILSGCLEYHAPGRHCFQTTYVNERFYEYYKYPSGHKILWILRNPTSVIYSMLYNWGNHTPNKLFMSCGISAMTGMDRWRYKLLGMQSISMLRRACWAYVGKTLQLFELTKKIGPDQLMIVDYNDLILQKSSILPAIYQFIDISYKDTYANKLHTKSLNKKRNLSDLEASTIQAICQPIYEQAKTLLSKV